MNNSPLTEKHLQEINRILNETAQLKLDIERARQAGIDVDTRCQQCDACISQLTQLKQAYFPGM